MEAKMDGTVNIVDEPILTLDEQLQMAVGDVQNAAEEFRQAGQSLVSARNAHDCREAQVFLTYKSSRREDGKPRTDAECEALTTFELGPLHDQYEAAKINFAVAQRILDARCSVLSALQTRAKMTTQTDAAIANSPY